MISRRFIFLAGLLLLTACGNNVPRLKALEVKGQDFHSHLAREYRSYVLALAEDGEWQQAEFFAAKGLRAHERQDVKPEPVPEGTNLPLSAATLEALGSARKELQTALAEPNLDAEQRARAQVFYDCWASEAIAHPSHADGCRGSYEQVMEKLKANLPSQPDYVIYFRSGNAYLNENARNVIRQIAIDLYEKHPSRILVSGFTDNFGDAEYNHALAAARASAASEALARAGLPEKHITIEENSRMADALTPAEQRRVEIRIRY